MTTRSSILIVRRLVVAVLVTGLVASSNPATAQANASPSNCSEMTTQTCAGLILRLLRTDLADKPEAALRTVTTYWVPKFEQAYRKLGDDTNTSDIDKIQDEVGDKLNPVTWATDASIDALLKKYLARIAAIWAAIGSAPVEGALAFIWPSQIASDATELKLVNEQIHRELFKVLEPKLRASAPSYLDLIQQADSRLGPQINRR